MNSKLPAYLVIALVAIIIWRMNRQLKEGFAATSPGTMVQLQTSHVPTEEDEYFYRHVYPRMVRKEIYNMTESDLY